MKDVVVGFMELLASRAPMIDSVFLFAGAKAHLFVGSPEFERQFGGGFAAFAGGAVEGCLDGVPVDAIQGVVVPLFGSLEVGAKILVVAFVEKIHVEFAAVGSVVNKEVSFGGGKERRDWEGATSVAGVGEGTGCVAHFVDSDWRGEIF